LLLDLRITRSVKGASGWKPLERNGYKSTRFLGSDLMPAAFGM